MADVEKVIEELKFIYDCLIEDEMSGNALVIDSAIQTIRELQSNKAEELQKHYEWGYCEGYEKAKEESDEVCEWKRTEDDYYLFEPACDSDVGYKYSENMIHEWENCPYCGRKIKVVE